MGKQKVIAIPEVTCTQWAKYPPFVLQPFYGSTTEYMAQFQSRAANNKLMDWVSAGLALSLFDYLVISEHFIQSCTQVHQIPTGKVNLTQF